VADFWLVNLAGEILKRPQRLVVFGVCQLVPPRRRLPVEALLAQELRPQHFSGGGSRLVARIGWDRDTPPRELAVVGWHLHAAGMMIC
jgi:hypothetical protein